MDLAMDRNDALRRATFQTTSFRRVCTHEARFLARGSTGRN